MSNHCPKNERIKRRYLVYVKEAQRYSETTVDIVSMALARYERYTNYKDFRSFNADQAVAFKNWLIEQRTQHTGKRLSQATAHGTLNHLKRFFRWLAGQPGYKAKLKFSDAEYLNISEKDARIARARREPRVATIEQIVSLLQSMPYTTDEELRDRALIAFTLLSGARDGAIASMKLKHVDIEKSSVLQDAREVKTKFGKTFTSFFFPLPDLIKKIVIEWVEYRQLVSLEGGEAPLFPATSVIVDADQNFRTNGLSEIGWATAGPIRAIFKKAFKAAGIPYFPPHSFRNTLATHGEKWCKGPEEFKAFSQNLGHERVLTTFTSYGVVPNSRQGEILQGRPYANEKPGSSDAKLEAFLRSALAQLGASE